MIRFGQNNRRSRALDRMIHNQSGAVAVEFAIVAALLFFMLFVLLDFGRLAFARVMAEKAAHLATRTAVVRPPACTPAAGFPLTHVRGTSASTPNYGTSCATGAGICAAVSVTCAGAAGNGTTDEIWTRIQPWLPTGAQVSDLTFTYATDANLGFLGGPFTPVVTVDINLPAYQFISPLGALAKLAGYAGAPIGQSLSYPTFSVSLPAEDLDLGDLG